MPTTNPYPAITKLPTPPIWKKTRAKFLIPVILESPFRGKGKNDQNRNIKYARLCMREMFLRFGEIPYASHLLYPQCLDDSNRLERHIGITGNLLFHSMIESVVFYIDLGFSDGMMIAYQNAQKHKKEIINRNLYKPWMEIL